MGNFFSKCLSSGNRSNEEETHATVFKNSAPLRPAGSRTGHWPSPHGDEIINTVAATNDSWESVSGAEDGAIKLCSWADGKYRVVQEWRQPCAVNRLCHAVVGSKELVVSGGRDGGVRVWRRDCATPLQTLKGHELTVNGVACCPEAPERVCSGSRDWTIRLWDADVGSETGMVKVEWNVVSFMKWIALSDCVLQASEDLQLRVWDVRSLARPAEVIKSAHNNVMTCCDVSRDGYTLLSSSNGFDGAGCELKVWDRRKGALLCDLSGHTQTVTCCAFLPEQLSSSSQQLVVSGSQDATLRVWDPTHAKCIDSISVANSHRLTSLAVCAPEGDSCMMATSSFSGGLGWWAVGQGGGLKLLREASDGPSILSSGVEETPH